MKRKTKEISNSDLLDVVCRLYDDHIHHNYITGIHEEYEKARQKLLTRMEAKNLNIPDVIGMCEHPLFQLRFWNNGMVECKKCGLKTTKF